MRSWFARLVIWCMVLSLPAASFGADLNAAMLRVHGKVLVNGAASTQDRAVFAGDTIASGDRASATLALPGGSVQVQSNSTVVFNQDSVTVRSGSARIATAKGMTARVDNVTVTPANNVADYSIRRSGSEMHIAAASGAITVTDGVRTLTVAPGQALNVKMRAAAPQGGGEGLSGMQWLIIGLVAVASTVAVVASTTEDEPDTITVP